MIKQLRTKNFGKLKDGTIELSDVTVFEGNNEAGKTTLFDAILTGLCRPKGNTQTGKSIKNRYGESFEIEIYDQNGQEISGTFPDETEFLNLYAIRSGDVFLSAKSGDNWVSEVQSRLFTGGIDPAKIIQDLESQSSDHKNKQYNKEIQALESDLENFERRLQEKRLTREDILTEGEKISGLDDQIKEISEQISKTYNEASRIKVALEFQEKIRNKNKTGQILLAMKLEAKLASEISSGAVFKEDSIKEIDSLQKEMFRIQKELSNSKARYEMLLKEFGKEIPGNEELAGLETELERNSLYKNDLTGELDSIIKNRELVNDEIKALRIRIEAYDGEISRKKAQLNDKKAGLGELEKRTGEAGKVIKEINDFFLRPHNVIIHTWNKLLLIPGIMLLVLSPILFNVYLIAGIASAITAIILLIMSRKSEIQKDVSDEIDFVSQQKEHWRLNLDDSLENTDSIEGIRSVLSSIKAAGKNASEDISALEAEIASIERESGEMESSLRRCSLKSSGIEKELSDWMLRQRVRSRDEYIGKLKGYTDLFIKTNEIKNDRIRFQTRKKELEASIQSLEKELEEKKMENETWLSEHGVGERDEYNNRVLMMEQTKAELKKVREQISSYRKDPLKLRLESEALLNELSQQGIPDEGLGEDEIKRMRTSLEEFSARLDSLKQTRTEKEKERLEKAGEIRGSLGTLPDEILSLERQIHYSGKKIHQLRLKKSAAKKAIEIFSNIAQDSALMYENLSDDVSGIFSEILGTQGQSVKIGTIAIKPEAMNDSLKASDKYGIIRSIDVLSSGTRDVLYFALRLALSKKNSRGCKSLFLDEPFLTLDEERIKSAVKFLRLFQEETKWQIIFFTKEKALKSAVQKEFPEAIVQRAENL